MMLHRVRFSEALEARLIEETIKRGLASIDQLVPVIVEEYFRMWDDLESGAALLKPDEAE
jgi:hypothetical protein